MSGCQEADGHLEIPTRGHLPPAQLAVSRQRRKGTASPHPGRNPGDLRQTGAQAPAIARAGSNTAHARRGNPTVVDVARIAEVSTATVSRVLNGQPRVHPALAERVRRAARGLEYRPSRVARSLRTRRSQVWALIISDIRNPFFTDMVRGVEDIAYQAGFSLVLCNAEEDAEKESSYLELAIAENVGGLILSPGGPATDLSPISDAAIPVVLVDRTVETEAADSVVVDNTGSAEQAVTHLLSEGYRRVGCITGPLSTTTGLQRYLGYRRAIEATGQVVDERLVAIADFREEGGRSAMERLLSASPRPDAVFVANNLMTVGALHAIAAAELMIPNEVGIVGFDDMSWGTLLSPPLTAVAQPTYDLGAEAGRLLLSRLQGYAGRPRVVTLAPRLRIRGSSVRRRARGS